MVIIVKRIATLTTALTALSKDQTQDQNCEDLLLSYHGVCINMPSRCPLTSMEIYDIITRLPWNVSAVHKLKKNSSFQTFQVLACVHHGVQRLELIFLSSKKK